MVDESLEHGGGVWLMGLCSMVLVSSRYESLTHDGKWSMNLWSMVMVCG